MNIKFSVLENLIKAKLSTKEIDLFLMLIKYQDLSGKVTGIHHKEVCEECHMCEQSFYSGLRVLQDKQLIRMSRISQDYDIEIGGNNFTDRNFKVGYIKTNDPMFATKEFKVLTGNEKLLVLDMFKQCRAAAFCSKTIGKQEFVKKYSELFGVCKKTIRRYLTHIRTLFDVRLKDKLYHFYIKKVDSRTAPAAQIFRERFVKMCVRRGRGLASSETLQDIAELAVQYQKSVTNVFMTLQEAILSALQQNKNLQPALVHSLFLDNLKRAEHIPQKGTKKKNMFNQFKQNVYDFDALEKILLEK